MDFWVDGEMENDSEVELLLTLEKILDERIRRSEAGESTDETVADIFEEVYREMGLIE